MATAPLGGLIASARHLCPPDADVDLLGRFASARDEAAFAVLVKRYGPLVLAACRRIVADAHLADDAFQATFVVLARKAHAIDGTRPLGPWLYGVATNVATRARDMLGLQRKRESLRATVPETAAMHAPPDAAIALLDEEINKLPATHREAVVLCELQGLTRKEAAKKLGIAEGTLSSRLAAARKKLAERLTARGAAPVAVVAGAGVPEALHAATVAASTGRVELGAQLLTLVRGEMAVTLLTTLKRGTVLTVLAVALVAVGGRWGHETVAAPVPKDAPDAGLIWLKHAKTGKLVGYKPNGVRIKELDAAGAHLDLRHGLIWKYDPKTGKLTGTNLDGEKVKEVVSPGHFLGFSDDGTKIMFAGSKGKPVNKPAPEEDQPLWLNGCTMHFRDLDGKAAVVETDIPLNPSGWFHWSPNGKRVIKVEPMTMKSYVLHYIFDSETKTTTFLSDGKSSPTIGLKQILCGLSPDGEWLLTRRIFSETLELSKVPLAGGAAEPLASVELDRAGARLSPDGRFVACLGYAARAPGRVPDKAPAVRVVNVQTGKVTEVARHEDSMWDAGLSWSPDGKRFAYLLGSDGADKFRSSLIVCDANGENSKTVLTLEDKRLDYVEDGWQLIGWFPATPNAGAPVPKMSAPVPKRKTDAELIAGLWHDGSDGESGYWRFSADGTAGFGSKKDPQAAKFRIDPSKEPKQLDWSHNGGKTWFLGVYELDGDTLRIALGQGGTGVRPEGVDKSNPLFTYLTLKRVK